MSLFSVFVCAVHFCLLCFAILSVVRQFCVPEVFCALLDVSSPSALCCTCCMYIYLCVDVYILRSLSCNSKKNLSCVAYVCVVEVVNTL